MSDSSDDDDTPRLSAHALAALQEFMQEKQDLEARLEQAEISGDVRDVKVSEDWQLSQFWYSESTAVRLAEEALCVAGDNGRIACISAPTAYKQIRQLKPAGCDVKCLEFDKRFQIYGEDFLFYDYNNPLDLPQEIKQSFDLVIADPPFLSEECLAKTAITAKFLAKDKVILCTGAIMEEAALKLLDAKPCRFQPKHENQLQNEFRCYTNYDSRKLNET